MKVSILDFGAQAGALNTKAIQSAIDKVSAEGGGTVVVPRGEFVSGSLQLRSNITLEVEAGGILKGSGDLAHYPLVPFHHNEFGEVRSFLWAIGEENIRLRGAGIIDMNHEAFMEMDKPDLRGPDGDLIAKLSPEQIAETTVVAKPRPSQPIFFHNCERLVFEELLVRNSPCWTFSISCSNDIKMRGVTVKNNLRVPNCDGINLTCSSNAVITGCVFHCADDCVAVSGITDWNRYSENIVISDCTMVSRSGGVRVGHLASKIRNIVISNLVLSDGNRGLTIFAGDDGVVENVIAHDLVFHTRLFAGFWWGKGEPFVISAADSTGRISGIRIHDVIGSAESGMVVAGKGGNVSDVELSDISIKLRPGRNRPPLGQWIDLQPAESRPLEKGHIPWIYADDVKGLKLTNVKAAKHAGETAEFSIEPHFRAVEEA